MNGSSRNGISPQILQGLLRRRTRIWLWAGFGGLLLLMGLLGGLALSFLYTVEVQQERIREDYTARNRLLDRLRSGVYLAGTSVRDFLSDATEVPSNNHRQQFDTRRKEVEQSLVEYAPLVPAGNRGVFDELSQEIRAYLQTLGTVFEWNRRERDTGGRDFMQQELLPGRLQILAQEDRISTLSEQQAEESSRAVSDALSGFRLRLALLLALTVLLGAALAGTTLWRLWHLEKESLSRFDEVVAAREELKHLSADLFSAQENERRRIARELHDEVGQGLYATMLGLGNLRSSMRNGDVEESLRQLAEVESMSGHTVRTVRSISLLLRPAMLDDLGLLPALKWLAREVTRTHEVHVDVFAANLREDLPENLPEGHRTCIYRVVQEAVHNAIRHGGAKLIRVDVNEAAGRIAVLVQDDGKGFDPEGEIGMGILGMQERVQQTGGRFGIESELGRGTTVRFEVPLARMDQAQMNKARLDEGHDTRPLRTA